MSSQLHFLADGFGLAFDELGGIWSLDNCGARSFTDRNIFIIAETFGIDTENLNELDVSILSGIFKSIDRAAQEKLMREQLLKSSKSTCYGHHYQYSDHREGVLRFPNSYTNENF